ncbi:MAG: hypothetical protein ACOY3I_03785 [Verrucomicrobiota bacterium]
MKQLHTSLTQQVSLQTQTSMVVSSYFKPSSFRFFAYWQMI